MERLTVQGLEFRMQKYGSRGPWIVCFHGYGGGPLDWHFLRPHLEAQNRLLILNLTPLFSCEKRIGFTRQVEIITELIAQVNLDREPMMFLGASYGATLSFAIRSKFKSLVTSQVLINPMPLNPLPLLRDLSMRMLFGMNMVPGALPLFLKTPMGAELLARLGEVFGFGHGGRRGLFGHSSRKMDLISKAVQRFAWIAQHEDWGYWENQLREHLAPTLIVTGNHDPLYVEKDFRSFQNLLPMSEHMSLESGRHMLTKTHGEELAREIQKFLNQLVNDPKMKSAG